jgi:hypothetical protein
METKTVKRYIAKSSLPDGDWMTQAAKGYSNIPEGEEVKFVREFSNFYGWWVDVAWGGRRYSVRHGDLIVREETRNILDVPEPNCIADFNKSKVKMIGKLALVDNNNNSIDSGIWIAKTDDNNIIYVDQANCSQFYTIVSSEDKPFQHNADSY